MIFSLSGFYPGCFVEVMKGAHKELYGKVSGRMFCKFLVLIPFHLSLINGYCFEFIYFLAQFETDKKL